MQKNRSISSVLSQTKAWLPQLTKRPSVKQEFSGLPDRMPGPGIGKWKQMDSGQGEGLGLLQHLFTYLACTLSTQRFKHPKAFTLTCPQGHYVLAFSVHQWHK